MPRSKSAPRGSKWIGNNGNELTRVLTRERKASSDCGGSSNKAEIGRCPKIHRILCGEF